MRRIAVGFFNQALTSGVNLALSLYLARELPLAEFGLFGAMFAWVFLLVGVIGGLVITQAVVLLSSADLRGPACADQYLSLFIVVVVAFGWLGAAITWVAVPWASEFGWIVLVAAAVSFKDGVVRIAHAIGFDRAATVTSVVLTVVVVAMWLSAELTELEVSAVTALQCVFLWNMAGAIAGLLLILKKKAQLSWPTARTVAHVVRGGSWAFLGVLIAWAQTQAYTVLTITFEGAAQLGLANSARLLWAPLFFMMPPIMNMLITHMVRLAAVSSVLARRRAVRYAQIALAAAVLYSGALYLLYEPAKVLVLGDSAFEIEGLVAVWGLVVAAQLLRSPSSVLFQARRDFRALTLISLVTTLVSLIVSAVLIFSYGVRGALIGAAIGEILLFVWLQVRLTRK